MDYRSVSCNRGAPLVSRGGCVAYDLNSIRWVDLERLAQKKDRLPRRHCVASTRSESLSRGPRAWPSVELSQTPPASDASPMACTVLKPSPFSRAERNIFLTPNTNQFNRLTQAIMIKPIKTAGIALLLGVVVLPSAQAQTPAQKAAQEVVRRQAAIIELRNKLAEAKTVEQGGNLIAAAILYEAAQNRGRVDRCQRQRY